MLPFLQGERFTARVDLKADRRAGRLLVPAAWVEPGADPGETAVALAAELRRLAGWLGLAEVAAPAAGRPGGSAGRRAGGRLRCTVRPLSSADVAAVDDDAPSVGRTSRPSRTSGQAA